ncbi:hypothetical protein D3C87_1410370 [compost metagenome]
MKTLKNIWIVLALGALLNLTACAGSDSDKKKSSDPYANAQACSEEVRQDYYPVLVSAIKYQDLEQQGRTVEMKAVGKDLVAQCSSFVEAHGDTVCKTSYDGVEGVIDGSLIRSDCAELKKQY